MRNSIYGKTLKLITSFSVISLLLISGCLHLELPILSSELNNPYELVVAAVSLPDSVDPSWVSDSVSKELIFNVYETLIFYDRENVDKFVPMLATQWWISTDGLTYMFKIRENVRFHDNKILTTEDVEYSFERLMVSGKHLTARFLYKSLLNVLEANSSDPTFGQRIDNAIESNGTHVWFNLAMPCAPFLGILCQPWCSIVNKDFCVTHGDWPGTWENWLDYHNHDAEHSPLDDPEPVMCGTGPYQFDYWEKGVEWSLVKSDDYWGDWPALGCRGYVERVIVKKIEDWSLRKSMFLEGQVDIAYVSKSNFDELFSQPGVRCIYPLLTFYCYGIFFTYNLSLNCPYLEPGVGYGELNESGIPPDFFSDVHVRKGFAYSLNYTGLVHSFYDWWEGGIYPGTPALQGLPFMNSEQEKYELNLTKAEEHFKEAWNGQLWVKGFRLTIVFKPDSMLRLAIGEILKANIESLNPRFHIELFEVPPFTDVYYPQITAHQMPLFSVGWAADYPDTHPLFHDFMHSEGYIPPFQRYCNVTVNALIDEALYTPNQTRRREIYFDLQEIYFNDCPSVVIFQTSAHHWERTWVQGWYYNPAYSGLYFYHLWKEDLLLEDLDLNGKIDILDIVVAAEAFASYYKVGYIHPRWNARADLNLDQKVDIIDVAIIAIRFGF